MINELMENKKITKYRLAKESGIAYTTINDICSGKAQLEKCSAETIYRISKVLGVSMENLIEPCFDKRSDFELFKSNTCHIRIGRHNEFHLVCIDKHLIANINKITAHLSLPPFSAS